MYHKCGYKILKPNDVTDFVLDTYASRSVTNLERGELVLKAIDLSKLSDTEKERHLKLLELIKTLKYSSVELYEKNNFQINTAMFKLKGENNAERKTIL